MTTAAELFALQETDLELDGAVEKLTEVEAQLGETEALLTARERVEGCRVKVDEAQKRQRESDSDVEDARQKAGGIEKKLYGGGVRNPKELEDYEADLVSLRSQLRKREDALLEVMLELDEAETALKDAEGTLSEIESSWKAEQASLTEERETLKAKISDLEARRSRQLDGMDRAAVALYGTLRERRQGRAVAVVERGLCQGCRITLPMSVLQKARAGHGLVQCVSCERILLVN